MEKEKPLSENIGFWDGGGYIITAAIWRTHAAGAVFDTFEIGIRSKSDPKKFRLLQAEKWNHQSVQEVANAIAHLLSIPTENYTPEWCQKYFTE